MQFIYDASGVGTPTGAWLCVTLGVWHPYKQANSVVWSHWGPRFLAPYFHHIVPGSNFSARARLITIISYFTYIRFSARRPAQFGLFLYSCGHKPAPCLPGWSGAVSRLEPGVPCANNALILMQCCTTTRIALILMICVSGRRLRLHAQDGRRRGRACRPGAPAEGLPPGGRGQCSEYVRALTASLLQWSEYQRVNHPCWQLFTNNASAFNEVSGEISLSVLAREIARGCVRSDSKKVSQTFKLGQGQVRSCGGHRGGHLW